MDELEEGITKQSTKGEVDGPSIRIYTLPILLYVDDVILMTHSYEGISDVMWDDGEKLQNSFIRRYLGVRVTTPYSLLLMETGRLPMEFHGLIRTLRYKVASVHCMDRSVRTVRSVRIHTRTDRSVRTDQ